MNPTNNGWPADAPTLLAAIGHDNTPEHFAALRERYDRTVLTPTRALAAALEPEFGQVRVFRPYVNRRFRPDAPPYRADTGGVATTPGGAERSVVLSAGTLTVTAGRWRFDPGQLRRYRYALDVELQVLVEDLHGWTLDRSAPLVRAPRGFRSDHPQLELLRLRGLLVRRSWPVGAWLAGPETLHRVRTAWRAATPLTDWLDRRVGPPAPPVSRPRPAATAPDDTRVAGGGNVLVLPIRTGRPAVGPGASLPRPAR